MLRDIRYTDDIRIDSYINQIYSGKNYNFKEEKGTLKIDIGFVALGYENKIQIAKLSREEKIDALINFLSENKLLRYERPVDSTDGPNFVLETCNAFDVNVSSKNIHRMNMDLRFWMSTGYDNYGTLCLLENFTYNDEPYNEFSKMSTFSALASFVFHARSKIDNSDLGKRLPRLDHPNPYSKIDETHPASHHYEYHCVNDYIWDFILDPRQLLSGWGCNVARSKSITVLYRLREFGPEAAYGFEKYSAFGYPIAIWETVS